ncbi:DUF1189 family protein [Candidatus Daviesbacteria bacterium]|nr:DUF1189 family protein [Candidatus Daviesbacteria bacterium]
MNFLKTVINSIYSPEFYSIVLTKSFKKNLSYFFLLILLLTITRLITLISPLFFETAQALQTFATDIIDCYPKDLKVKITKGQVTINAEEPYFISSCEGDKSQNLVVIDTKTPYSSTKFDEYQVAAWITKDSIVYKKSDVESRTYSLAQIKDFKLNQEVLNSFYQKFSPYLKFVGPMLLLLSFIGLYLAYILRLIHLLLLASLIWLLSKIFRRTLGFGQSYKVSLYAITLGLIVDLVVSLTSRYTYFHGFPFMVSILTLGVVIVNSFLPKKTS